MILYAGSRQWCSSLECFFVCNASDLVKGRSPVFKLVCESLILPYWYSIIPRVLSWAPIFPSFFQSPPFSLSLSPSPSVSGDYGYCSWVEWILCWSCHPELDLPVWNKASVKVKSRWCELIVSAALLPGMDHVKHVKLLLKWCWKEQKLIFPPVPVRTKASIIGFWLL